MNDRSIKPATWFWIVSGIGFIWNLLGVFAYNMDVMSESTDLAATYGEACAAIMEAGPAWVTGAYAIAVFAGAIGCLLLLLRRRFAIGFLVASFLAVVAQNIYWQFMTDARANCDMLNSTIMPIIVFAISLGLIFFARAVASKGWLR